MTIHNFASSVRYAGLCAIATMIPASSFAAAINYGDVDDFANGGALEYQEVTEDSGTDATPLFGAPEVVVNRLDFDPTAFASSANGAGDSDFTDGQLNFMIDALPGAGILSFDITESGSYSFGGLGTAATRADFGVLAEVTILEVDGVAVTPIDVVASNSASLNAVDNPGFAAPWSLGLRVELGPALSGMTFTEGVTLAEVVINNTLFTSSEAGTGAFIDKKDFFITPSGDLDPDNVVPEPAAALLATLALAGFAARRR